jgi:acyl dehydratase
VIEDARVRLQASLGAEVHVSDWHAVTQERVDGFAAVTGDRQWIHTDVARAARESPWRTTIAHGFLTIALYPLLRGFVLADRPPYPGVRAVVNYGLNKLRFTNAVRVGARVRGRCRLLAVEDFTGGLQVTEEFTVEVEGERTPACVAEVVMRLYFA